MWICMIKIRKITISDVNSIVNFKTSLISQHHTWKLPNLGHNVIVKLPELVSSSIPTHNILLHGLLRRSATSTSAHHPINCALHECTAHCMCKITATITKHTSDARLNCAHWKCTQPTWTAMFAAWTICIGTAVACSVPQQKLLKYYASDFSSVKCLKQLWKTWRVTCIEMNTRHLMRPSQFSQT